MTTFLLVAALLYAGVCALLWWQQDRIVFPGAGRGDRGLPPSTPHATVAWLGDGELRCRIATLAPAQPRAVALYFGGNGEDLYASVLTAECLAAYGMLAIAAEHPGYGASAGRPSVASLLAAATAACAHARARADELHVPLIVVGSSLGTFCACHVAAAGRVDKLVLRAPPTSLAAVASATFWWLPVGPLLAHRFDNLATAPRVACPALVVHGAADTIVPDRYGRELANALPHAEFVSVPGCGHNDLDVSPRGPVGARLRAFFAAP